MTVARRSERVNADQMSAPEPGEAAKKLFLRGRARRRSRGVLGVEGGGIALLTGAESARVSRAKPTVGSKPGSSLQSKHFPFLPALGPRETDSHLQPPLPLPLLPRCQTGAAAAALPALAAGKRWGAACHSASPRLGSGRVGPPAARPPGPGRGPSPPSPHSAGGGAPPAAQAPAQPARVCLFVCFILIIDNNSFRPVSTKLWRPGGPRRCPGPGPGSGGRAPPRIAREAVLTRNLVFALF